MHGRCCHSAVLFPVPCPATRFSSSDVGPAAALPFLHGLPPGASHATQWHAVLREGCLARRLLQAATWSRLEMEPACGWSRCGSSCLWHCCSTALFAHCASQLSARCCACLLLHGRRAHRALSSSEMRLQSGHSSVLSSRPLMPSTSRLLLTQLNLVSFPSV